MYELIHCRCGRIYGERPETYSSSNLHPHNFCEGCDRVVTMADCWAEPVPEGVWVNTPKFWFSPYWLKD